MSDSKKLPRSKKSAWASGSMADALENGGSYPAEWDKR
jgi:hypothetical protein